MTTVNVGVQPQERHWGAGTCPGESSGAGEGPGAQVWWGAAYSLMSIEVENTECLRDKHNIYIICVFQCTFFCTP